MKSAGDVLREAREREGLSQTQLSSMVDMTQTRVSFLERQTSFTWSTLVRILDKLGYELVLRKKKGA